MYSGTEDLKETNELEVNKVIMSVLYVCFQ